MTFDDGEKIIAVQATQMKLDTLIMPFGLAVEEAPVTPATTKAATSSVSFLDDAWSSDEDEAAAAVRKGETPVAGLAQDEGLAMKDCGANVEDALSKMMPLTAVAVGAVVPNGEVKGGIPLSLWLPQTALALSSLATQEMEGTEGTEEVEGPEEVVVETTETTGETGELAAARLEADALAKETAELEAAMGNLNAELADEDDEGLLGHVSGSGAVADTEDDVDLYGEGGAGAGDFNGDLDAAEIEANQEVLAAKDEAARVAAEMAALEAEMARLMGGGGDGGSGEEEKQDSVVPVVTPVVAGGAEGSNASDGSEVNEGRNDRGKAVAMLAARIRLRLRNERRAGTILRDGACSVLGALNDSSRRGSGGGRTATADMAGRLPPLQLAIQIMATPETFDTDDITITVRRWTVAKAKPDAAQKEKEEGLTGEGLAGVKDGAEKPKATTGGGGRLLRSREVVWNRRTGSDGLIDALRDAIDSDGGGGAEAASSIMASVVPGSGGAGAGSGSRSKPPKLTPGLLARLPWQCLASGSEAAHSRNFLGKVEDGVCVAICEEEELQGFLAYLSRKAEVLRAGPPGGRGGGRKGSSNRLPAGNNENEVALSLGV